VNFFLVVFLVLLGVFLLTPIFLLIWFLAQRAHGQSGDGAGHCFGVWGASFLLIYFAVDFGGVSFYSENSYRTGNPALELWAFGFICFTFFAVPIYTVRYLTRLPSQSSSTKER
jgi:hypothetical protein